MPDSMFSVIRDEPNRTDDDANGLKTIIKTEIKKESTSDSYATNDRDVVDSKDGLQSLVTSANIKSE